MIKGLLGLLGLGQEEPDWEEVERLASLGHDYTGSGFGRNALWGSKQEDYGDIDIWKNRLVKQIDTDLGKRYYLGEGTSFGRDSAKIGAELSALGTFQGSPADSLTTKQFNLLQDYGMFPK